ALTDDFEDLVVIQPAQRARVGRRGKEGEIVRSVFRLGVGGRQLLNGRHVKKGSGLSMRPQQGFDAPPQGGVTTARALQIGGPLCRVLVESCQENLLLDHRYPRLLSFGGFAPLQENLSGNRVVNLRGRTLFPDPVSGEALKTMRNPGRNHVTAVYFFSKSSS